MGLLDRVPGFSQLSGKVSASIPTSTSFHSVAGIEGKGDGTVHSGPATSGTGTRIVGTGKAAWWNDEDGTSLLSISLRGLQTFFPFINLCVYIALAAFQSRWKVGVSFLVGLSLFFNLEALAHGGVLLATSIAADKVKFLRSLDRLMRQIRVAAIINSFQAFCMLLMAIITTVSANSGGCKDAEKDSHADVEGYIDALPGFCRNKRAGAAFFWLNAVAWLAALSLTLVTFARVRRHPISSGFVPPRPREGAEDEENVAFEPESFNVRTRPDYRPSHDYADGEARPFEGSYSTYHHNETGEIRDPFEDPHPRSAAVAPGYEAVDPYEAIKKSMELRAGGRKEDY